MTNKSKPLDKRTFTKLSRLYIFALSAIALSVIISQFLIRKHLDDQQSDSTVINIAGRQRMLSQKLTKEIVLLSTINNLENREVLKEKLKNTLLLWKTSHNSLQKGNINLGLPNENSVIVKKLFKKLNPVFEIIKIASLEIIKEIEEYPKAPINGINIEKIKENEGVFLHLMDQIVNQYDSEAEKKVSWLRRLELLLMTLTLLLLLGEFLFVFWPTAKTVKKSISQLLQAERKAKKMAFDADELSATKEKSIKELSALTRAMDEALLFARINSNGTIVQMGNKFSRLFKFNKFNSNTNFSEVISIHENEQLVIENVILKHKKTGWQGELKTSTTSNEGVWLEMSIIPFNTNKNSKELLIIASDITKKKEAQLEIERLTQDSFEEKMNQQKIISSKIIENQENEQNRIAKDVHDGIGQMLTGLKYNLESINLNDIDKATIKIEQLKDQAANIIKGVRAATFNLTPPELTDHGIVPAISKLTHELSKLTGKNILLYNETNFNQRLDSLVEINIYRITQEAINNAIKYADSTHIIVTISYTEKILSIVIDDNGKGFDISKIKSEKNGEGGMGLTFMRERIKYINGRLFINSVPNKNTRITLNVPL